MQYVKIKDAVVEQIESGLLMPKQKLPSERQLAESFDTTRVTLREALSLLEAEGKVYREDRRGWFISPEPLIYDPSQSAGFTEMAFAQQRKPETKLITAKSMLANKQASKQLNLKPFSNVYCIDRVRYLDDRPVAFVTTYAHPDLFPNLLEHDLSASLIDVYRQHYHQEYQAIRYRITASSLMGQTAQALRATSGSPATLVEKIRYNQDGILLDCAFEFWRHDAMCIESVADFNIE
ncbi:MAG TPA: phosphonate utilization transcriptional regulator PhnR [Vibrio sp.]|uniref:phosphonate utilization transcriptional regulator PhnR n=1 Tax=Vibrio TaxID=662 RepID=UPI000ECDA420|nr:MULTISPECIES: phosphonate utilization transcriptional regulator PhnR [Vibrio]HCH01913.1 phosphonate utilization transcriptional regulator PhnR [Vibrio sp.]